MSQSIARHKAHQAAQQRSKHIAPRGQVLPSTQQHRVLIRKSRQGGIPAAEPRSKRQPPMRRFHTTRHSKAAEHPHEQTSTEINQKRVPGHIRRCNPPPGADIIAGEIAQHAAGKTPAAHA